MSGFAWVTLATNDSYSLGALVLAHSLRRVNTAHQLAILITPGVSEAMRTQLSAVYNVVKVVDVLDSKDEANLTLLARPELGITFTKLHAWRLVQFSKCVFLDADTLVLQNCDELFEREELSAAPDAGWPDCFNSGVFVFSPADDTFNKLIEFALVHGSFDGGDQGLLNLYYQDWATKDITKHLPFIYNMCSTATYSYLPAFKQFGESLKIIHFIGSSKPWLQVFDTETGLARVSGDSHSIGSFIQLWWDLFCTYVHSSLSTEMGGLAGALASITLGSPLSSEQTALQEHLRRQGWEQGNIDYMGRDSFDNIWKKISETINAVQSTSPQVESSSVPSSQDAPTSKSVEAEKPEVQLPPSAPTLAAFEAPSAVAPISEPAPVVTAPVLPQSELVEVATPEPIPTSPPVVLAAGIKETVSSPSDAPLSPPPETTTTIPSVDAQIISSEPSPKPTPIPLVQPESPPATPAKVTSPPQSPISSPPQLPTTPPIKSPTQQSPLTPPTSPKIEAQPIQPSTPTVTSPTPPTSPPVDPFEAPLPAKLKVDTETPETPPAGPTDEPPIPPKRKGVKAAQEQASKTQTKGGKPAKGKK